MRLYTNSIPSAFFIKEAELDRESGWKDTLRNVGLTGLMTVAPMFGTGCEDGTCQQQPPAQVQQSTMSNVQVDQVPDGRIVAWVPAPVSSGNDYVDQKLQSTKTRALRQQATKLVQDQFGKVVMTGSDTQEKNGTNYLVWYFSQATPEQIQEAGEAVQQMQSSYFSN